VNNEIIGFGGLNFLIVILRKLIVKCVIGFGRFQRILKGQWKWSKGTIGRVFFAMGISPGQKMVSNPFGKRNFIQPMGRPKHAVKVPCF